MYNDKVNASKYSKLATTRKSNRFLLIFNNIDVIQFIQYAYYNLQG